MKALAAAIGFAKGIPLLAYAAVLGAGVLGGIAWSHLRNDERQLRAAVTTERERIYAGAKTDSVLLARLAAQTTLTIVRTDTVIRTVERIVRDVRTVVQRVDVEVPDSVLRAFPVIVELRTTALRLTDSVGVLVVRMHEERAATRMQLDVLQSQLTASRIETMKVSEERDTWRAESGRKVTKTRAVTIGGVALGVGAAACYFIPKCGRKP